MAFSDVRKELDCSICLNMYSDPVMLRCGHNFCRDCIAEVLGAQEKSGGYSCPECREDFLERPELQRNIVLRNIVEDIKSGETEKEESRVFCTYCFHSDIPAVMSCLLCEASLCEDHLKVHSKSSPHVLSHLTKSMDTRKCPVHKKVLEYYCTEDSACLCGSCRLHGEHEEHQVKTLEEASGKKKEDLTRTLQKLSEKKKKMEETIQGLERYKRRVQGSVAGVTKKVTTMFRDIRRQLDFLEKTVLNEISRQVEKDLFPASDFIQQLKIEKDELSRKMRHIQEMCDHTDPLTVLQESDIGDDEDGGDEDGHGKLLRDGGDLDVVGISHTLHTGLYKIVEGVWGGICIAEPEDISLDEDSAHNYLHLSDDKKVAHRMDRSLNRPQTPQRFQDYQVYQGPALRTIINLQVLSRQSFSSGRHYWDVDVGGSQCCRIGMCYPSIVRNLGIGSYWNSWCLEKSSSKLSVIHNNSSSVIDENTSLRRVRVYLDYEAGRLSFFRLGLPIRHLHTFTATFTEPLRVGLYVEKGCIKLCGGNKSM